MIRIILLALLPFIGAAQTYPTFTKYYKPSNAPPSPPPDSIPNDPTWRPDSIAELEIWLTAYDIDADGIPNEENNNTDQATWHDKSSNGYDAIGINSTEPSVDSNSLNGSHGLHFHDERMEIASGFAIDGDHTMVVIFDREGDGNTALERLMCQPRAGGSISDANVGSFELTIHNTSDWFRHGGKDPGSSTRTLNIASGTSAFLDSLHVHVITYDVGGDSKYYIDEVLKNTETSASSLLDNGREVEIGYDTFQNTGTIDGIIYEIIVFSKVLSSTELTDLYDNYINTVWGL